MLLATIELAAGTTLVTGMASVRATRRSAATHMRLIPGTLQFSAFRGYYFLPDDNLETPLDIPTSRVGRGVQARFRVLLDTDADFDAPLVTAAEPIDPAPINRVWMADRPSARPSAAAATATAADATPQPSLDTTAVSKPVVPVTPAVPAAAAPSAEPSSADRRGALGTIALGSAYLAYVAATAPAPWV